MKVYLGIDVGSVTTKLVLLGEDRALLAGVILPTEGRPVARVQQGLRDIRQQLPAGAAVAGVAVTGSGRYLTGVLVGADLVKNEITCQAVGALHYIPEAQTVVEIGGQDSKIIIIRDGVVTDFGMNTVCAAGTGSFLDHQAARLNLSREEFGRQGLASTQPVRINARCTVFAESDMIHKQQTGCPTGDIIYGLCRGLVTNYLSNVAAGKEILPPVVFQGGVAANPGIVRVLREELGMEVIVPPDHEFTGALGAALLVSEETGGQVRSRFRGFDAGDLEYQATSFECRACPARCEVEQLTQEGRVLARRGGRCELWPGSPETENCGRGAR